MVNKRLAEAYKRLMVGYAEYERHEEDYEPYSETDDEQDYGYEDHLEQQEEVEELKRQEDEIRKKIEECKTSLRQQQIISHDEQLIAVINSVLSDVSIDISPDNLDVILSVLPEESKLSKQYKKKPIDLGMGGIVELEDIGKTYKECGIDLEGVNASLLLDRDFMKGYLTGHSNEEIGLETSHTDLDMTNEDIINYINSLCDEISR